MCKLVRLQTTIPQQVDKEFRCIIGELDLGFKKYTLKKHTTRAIKQYIEIMKQEKQHQQHSTYTINSVSKDEDMIALLTDLMKEIKTILYWDKQSPLEISCGSVCHQKILKDTIGKIQGRDHRTKVKWFKRLVEFNFIRKMVNSKDQYRILNDGHKSISSQEERKQQFDQITEGLV